MSAKQLDDWRVETQSSLQKSKLFLLLKEKCGVISQDAQVMALVDEAVYYCAQRTKLVVRHLKEYTLHDATHLFRVLTLMERLLPEATLNGLSVPEVMLLILAAFFHDIGMAPPEQEVMAWLDFWDESTEPRHNAAQTDAFGLFAKARPDRLQEISHLQKSGLHNQARLVQEYLVAEYIRSTHADRARQIIQQDWGDKILFRDTNLSSDLASLCFSHAENPVALLDLDAALSCGPDTYACLPFLGVILRLADILDFDAKRTPQVLFSHIGVRHPVSLLEWKKHRQINSWQISPKRIAFSASCEHPAIEAAIHRFCDLIDDELATCGSVLQNISDPSRDPFPVFYRIPLPAAVDRKRIKAKQGINGRPTYLYRDSQFRLSQSQVIDLLMGTALYGDPAVAIREVVQNSIDACLVRSALEEKWGNPYEPKISIEFSNEHGQDVLTVADNGIGMDQEIIDKYYATVGASYYKSAEFYALLASTRVQMQPISRFGIGILSCFMVADSMSVHTRRLLGPHTSSEPLEIRIEGLESIFWILRGHRDQPGTETRLSLRPKHPWCGMEDEGRIQAIGRLFPNPPFPIKIRGLKHSKIHTGEVFRSAIAKNWVTSAHIRQINVSLDHPEHGIAGQAALGILQADELPVSRKILFVKNVRIEDEDESIELQTVLTAGSNEVKRMSDSLEFDDDEVSKNTGFSTELKSNADFAIHGISMPMNLFPDYWERQAQRTALVFPFPMKLKIDVIGNRDLNLNTARSLVIYDEKWTGFVEILSCLLCQAVRAKVTPKYWARLTKLWPDILNDVEGARPFLWALKNA